MPFIINCPGCKRKLRVKEHLIGKNIKCPACGVKLPAQVPGTFPQAATPNGTPVVAAPAVPTPGAVGKVVQTTAPTVSPPPPPSSSGNEEPLEVLDPIVLDEPPTPTPKNTVIGAARLQLPKETEPRQGDLPSGKAHLFDSAFPVFALLTALLLAALTLGVIGGWWINRSIESVRSTSQAAP